MCPYSLDVPGGVGTHVLGEASWLAGRGHRVTLIAPGTQPRPGSHGVDVVLVGNPTPFRFNGSVARLAVLPRQVRTAVGAVQQADVVHVHEPLTPGIAFAGAQAANSLLVTHHASFAPNPMLELVLRRRAWAIGSYRALAVSHAAQQTAAAVTGRAPEVVPNAITLPVPPRAADEHPWRGGVRPRVAFVGRAGDPRKGFVDFEAVATRLASSADFVALGPDTDVTGTRVPGMGLVTEQHRWETLQTCDVVVAPNRSGESFGLVLVEALAAGCAVAASDLPGFKETLQQAEAEGLATVFARGNVEAAAAAVQQLLSAPIDPLRAHEHARRWSWEVVGPQVLEVLGQLADH